MMKKLKLERNLKKIKNKFMLVKRGILIKLVSLVLKFLYFFWKYKL